MLMQSNHDALDRLVFSVLEQTTPLFEATLVGEDGTTPIPGSTLSTLTLTLYADDANQTILNNRDNQNVLQQNGVTVDEFGLLQWILSPEDLAIVDNNLPIERHIALFQWTWGVGRAGKYEFVLAVSNLSRVN